MLRRGGVTTHPMLSSSPPSSPPPQALVQEEVLRHWGVTTAYRMDLGAARGPDPAAAEAERQRFLAALRPVIEHKGPKLIVTDSQVGVWRGGVALIGVGVIGGWGGPWQLCDR